MLNIFVVVVAVVITLLLVVVVVVVAVILVAVAARTRFCKQTNIKTAATNKTQTRVASASIVRPGGGAASLLFAIPPYPASPLPTAANPKNNNDSLHWGSQTERRPRQCCLLPAAVAQLQLQLQLQRSSAFNFQ